MFPIWFTDIFPTFLPTTMTMIMAIILMINFIYRLYIYIYIHVLWGATIVKPEIHTFRGSRTSAGWCPLLHAYCWKKVWLSEVPCQHTTSSQHVRVCLVGLKTTSNTARGVFGPFPADYFTMAALLGFCFWRMSHPRVPGCSWSPCSPQGASEIGFLPRSWLVFRWSVWHD